MGVENSSFPKDAKHGAPATGLSGNGDNVRLKTSMAACFLFLYWCLSGMVLWWSYDVTALIRGGYYREGQAVRLIGAMALIISLLTALAWWLVPRQNPEIPTWRLIWRTVWRTGLLLLVYGAAVLACRQFSPSNKPMNDSAFLPILGSINSHFFSEVGWLSYMLNVTPIMACFSGILYYFQNRLSARSNVLAGGPGFLR